MPVSSVAKRTAMRWPARLFIEEYLTWTANAALGMRFTNCRAAFGLWLYSPAYYLLDIGSDKYVQLALRRKMLKYVHSVKTIRNQLRIQG
jgi:hypothetical protein